MGKNIVVFSDGTGQEGGTGNNSNVYKLYNMVLDRSPKQIAFYDRGLGTGWRKITGKGAGMGISKNISECYEFIFENYEAGDKIYLFGFSRGATTVRSLSGFIHLFGILPRARSELIAKAYKIYKKSNPEKRESAAKAFVEQHHTMWCTIKFLGVWDTVAALGVPIKSIDIVMDKIPFFKHSFHDLSLSRSVENACHALAIDDERLSFHPILWDTKIAKKQTMKQVWFCGMHTDVGGGYSEWNLSDVTLKWMCKMAKQNGLLIYPKHKVKVSSNADGKMHDSRGKGLAKFYRKKVRSWCIKTHGQPCIHSSVLRRTLNRYNKKNPPYKPWILAGSYKYETEP
jgi:uncharacterized protein (DUF2235 family)